MPFKRSITQRLTADEKQIIDELEWLIAVIDKQPHRRMITGKIPNGAGHRQALWRQAPKQE